MDPETKQRHEAFETIEGKKLFLVSLCPAPRTIAKAPLPSVLASEACEEAFFDGRKGIPGLAPTLLESRNGQATPAFRSCVGYCDRCR